MSQDIEPQAQTGDAIPAENGEKAKSEERKYSESDLQRIVKDRLWKQKQSFEKKTIDPSGEQNVQKSSGNVEEDLRAKLNRYESDHKGLAERLNKLRIDNLRTVIEKKAIELNVVDPELITDRFLSKGLVRYDDDDSIVVENADNNLDELFRNELANRPYLVKSTAKGGVGSKAPGSVKSPSNTNVANMTPEEFAAFKERNYGVSSPAGKKNWLTNK